MIKKSYFTKFVKNESESFHILTRNSIREVAFVVRIKLELQVLQLEIQFVYISVHVYLYWPMRDQYFIGYEVQQTESYGGWWCPKPKPADFSLDSEQLKKPVKILRRLYSTPSFPFILSRELSWTVRGVILSSFPHLGKIYHFPISTIHFCLIRFLWKVKIDSFLCNLIQSEGYRILQDLSVFNTQHSEKRFNFNLISGNVSIVS